MLCNSRFLGFMQQKEKRKAVQKATVYSHYNINDSATLNVTIKSKMCCSLIDYSNVIIGKLLEEE